MSTQLSIHDVERIILEDGAAIVGDTVWVRLRFHCRNRETIEIVAFPAQGREPLRVVQPAEEAAE